MHKSSLVLSNNKKEEIKAEFLWNQQGNEGREVSETSKGEASGYVKQNIISKVQGCN